jgi:hypothetical protein
MNGDIYSKNMQICSGNFLVECKTTCRSCEILIYLYEFYLWIAEATKFCMRINHKKSYKLCMKYCL